MRRQLSPKDFKHPIVQTHCWIFSPASLDPRGIAATMLVTVFRKKNVLVYYSHKIRYLFAPKKSPT